MLIKKSDFGVNYTCTTNECSYNEIFLNETQQKATPATRLSFEKEHSVPGRIFRVRITKTSRPTRCWTFIQKIL
jgi:hypothetical protein